MLKLSKIVILLSVGFILFAGYSQRPIQDSDILQVTDSNLEDYQKRWEDVATYIEGKASSFSNEFTFSDDVTIDSSLTVTGLLTSNGGRVHNVTDVDAATYAILSSDEIVNVTYTDTGAVTVTINTDAISIEGWVCHVKDAGGNAGSNNITIATEASETIDGAATQTINTNYNSVSVYSDGSNLFIY